VESTHSATVETDAHKARLVFKAITLEEASTHKSAKTHDGNAVVTRDLDR